MTDSTEANIQYSTKVGDDILLVRASDGDEFKARTEDLAKALDETADQWIEIRQLLLGKSVVATGVVGSPDSQVVAPTQSAPPPGSDGALNCVHGRRVRRDGTSAKGPWTGDFCALPKGSPGACTPIWSK